MTELGVAPGPQQLPLDANEFMARIGRMPLMHQPGERWMYHTGADILAVLIARISGMRLEDFLQERLFTPLGMRDTGFSVAPAAQHRLAACYTVDDGGLLQEWAPTRGGADVAAAPSFPNALLSTVDDYLAFARMLLDEGHGPRRRVLRRDSVRLMMTDHLTRAQKDASPFFPGFWETHGWGFGAAVTLPGGGIGRPGSYGWAGGFGTTMLVDPEARMTTIVLTQRLMRGPDDLALHMAVQALAYQGLTD
jgi:CubicO group peptidase (beta-lactamase class C family)